MLVRVLSRPAGDAPRRIEVAHEDRVAEARVPAGVEVAPGDVVEATPGADGDLEVGAVHLRASGPPVRDGDVFRWRRSTAGATRMSRLWQRQRMVRTIREYLYDQGFLEIEAPLLVQGACPDAHLEVVEADGGTLVTSTEYQLKRLAVGGFERVFSLTRNFRARERGRLHSPEFAMLEWARVGAPMRAIEDDAERFVRLAVEALRLPGGAVSVNGRTVDLVSRPWQRLTVREALARHLGLMVDDFAEPALQAAAKRADVRVPDDVRATPGLTLSYLLDQAQRFLGDPVPTFLTDWPASMTSSAQLRDDAPGIAVRSELYMAGIEVADGFPFLCDPALQRETFARELARRAAEGKPAVALDRRYLDALDQGLPPGAGMALGLDRLALVLTGADRLTDVQAFGWDEL